MAPPGCVFLFPGQSSARPDAIARARAAHPQAEAVARIAAQVLGGEAAAWLGSASARLDSNRDVQIVVFLATQMYLAGLCAEGIDARASMGLSLGEFSHLVHIGALDLATAIALVSERGRCFDRAPHGSMVTVLAVDEDTVAAVVAQAAARGPIVISNYNAPTQHVIAGDADAVAWAAERLEDDHGAITAVIERRVPMHSPLMAEPARVFHQALASTAWRPARLPYRPNVIGRAIARGCGQDYVEHLVRHVHQPVRWRDGVDELATTHRDAIFVEVGPGTVIHNMLGRGSWRSLARGHADAPDEVDPQVHFASLVTRLRG